MSLHRILGAAMLAIGIALAVWGIQASDSIASSFHRFFTGTPTEKSIWLLVGGAIVASIGVGLLASKRTQSA